MARRSTGKKKHVSLGNAVEKTENKLENNDNSSRRHSKRLSTDKGSDETELSLINKSYSKNEVLNDSKVTKEMARSYGRYEQLKNTPDHLFGLDGRLMSSDEDSDVDIGDSTREHNSRENFSKKVCDFLRDNWKRICGGFFVVFLAGILTSILLRGYNSSDISDDTDLGSQTLKKIEEKVDRLSSVLQELAHHSEESIENKSLLSEKAVLKIVQAALERYNADKVGMADFALESSGAQIHDRYHSDTYDVGAARVVLFGLPLWFDVKPPRVILQADNSPGNCWAFKGNQGYVVIKLSKKITPTAFTLEHIPKMLSTTGDGTTPSAPREFTIWAWKDAKGDVKVLLGNYVFDSDGHFLQTFNVEFVKDSIVTQFIEFRVFSNHGNKEYTCVYRLRVHGKP